MSPEILKMGERFFGLIYLNEWHLWTPLRMQAVNRGMLARSRMLPSVRPR